MTAISMNFNANIIHIEIGVCFLRPTIRSDSDFDSDCCGLSALGKNKCLI